MRQGKADSILDCIFREEFLTVALKKDTAIDLDEKIRGLLADENIESYGTRKFLESRSSLTADTARAGPRRPSPRRLLQRSVTKSGTISVRQEAGDRARDRPGGYA